MKAVIFDSVNVVKVVDIPKPGLEAPQDALVRITHSSICGSDLGIVQGKIAALEAGFTVLTSGPTSSTTPTAS